MFLVIGVILLMQVSKYVIMKVQKPSRVNQIACRVQVFGCKLLSVMPESLKILTTEVITIVAVLRLC